MLGLENDFGCQPSAEEWQQLYKTAQKQSLVGVLFNAVSRVPADSRPPVDILLQWMSHAEYIQGLNRLFNSHSAHLTKVLEDEEYIHIKAEDMEAVRQFIIKHYDVLLKHWNQEISTMELHNALKSSDKTDF